MPRPSVGPAAATKTINMKGHVHQLRFRVTDRDIFEAVRSGAKTVETRAATVKYMDIAAGDELVFRCGRDSFRKKVARVRQFGTITGLLRRYRPRQIHPAAATAADLKAMYAGFPGYREKIRKFGLMAMELGE